MTERITTSTTGSDHAALSASAELATLPGLHDQYTAAWHQPTPPHLPAPPISLRETLLAQHRANYDLWHTEDRARAPNATDADLAEVKRTIDTINQLRNDLAERCDALLLASLEPLVLPASGAELHTESPGLMIDRLSILSLKIFHTREELQRPQAGTAHLERNRDRLAILLEQRDELAAGLVRLWTRVLAGQLRFRIYRQLKMYNDPMLNPVIYANADVATATDASTSRRGVAGKAFSSESAPSHPDVTPAGRRDLT